MATNSLVCISEKRIFPIPSLNIVDTDFDHFLSSFNSATDYNKFFSGSQSIGTSPVEHVRPSQVHTSMQPRDVPSRSRAIACSLQDFDPYTSSRAGLLHFRGQPTSAAFQSTADPTSLDFQGNGTQNEHSPMFPYNFNGDFDSAALHRRRTPPLFPSIGKDASSTCSLASAPDTASTRRIERSSGTSEVLSGLLSLGAQNDVSPRRPQDLRKGIETCYESRRNCMTSALRILQKLHIPPSACLNLVDETSTSPASSQPRKTDSVLSTNRDVVRLMTGMLKCSCLSSSQIQLVLSIICGKLIAWYRAIIRNSPDDRPDACTDTDEQAPARSDSTLKAATGMTNERVLHQPFTVGEYSLDTGLESKIRAQVVSSELHQLEALVANLLGRIQEENPSGNNHVILSCASGKRSRSTSTMGSSGLSSAVQARLTAFLHRQLRDAKAESTAIATREV